MKKDYWLARVPEPTFLPPGVWLLRRLDRRWFTPRGTALALSLILGLVQWFKPNIVIPILFTVLVVYGLGTCDRERFERLRELAMPMLEGAH